MRSFLAAGAAAALSLSALAGCSGDPGPNAAAPPSTSVAATDAPPASPWTVPGYQVGLLSAPASVGGSGLQDPIVVTPARRVTDAGSEGWGIERTGAPDRWIDLSPAARYYVSCTWAGKDGPADGSDRCRITEGELAQWVKRTDVPQEFWYHLDAQGKIDQLFQVYHP